MAFTIAFLMLTLWLTGIHSLGHLLAGKILNIEADVFNLGWVGPKLAEFTLGTTRFELRALALGGYVRFNEVEEASLKRIILFCSGSFATFLMSGFLLWLYLITGSQLTVPEGALIIKVDTSTAHVNLVQGDIITMANDQLIRNGPDLAQKLGQWQSGELTLTLTRNGEVRQIVLNHQFLEGEAKVQKLGIVFGSLSETRRLGPIEAVINIPRFLQEFTILVLMLPSNFIKELIVGQANPITIANTDTNFDERMFSSNWLYLTAVLSLALSVTNMFPLPALNGSQVLMDIIQMLVKRPLSEWETWAVYILGLVILITPTFVLSYLGFDAKNMNLLIDLRHWSA